MIFINKSQAGVNNTARMKMKNLKKKERKAIQQEIADEAYEKYMCLCDVQELSDEKLLYAVLKLLEKRNEPVEVGLATLKAIIMSVYTTDVIEEMGFDLDDFKI